MKRIIIGALLLMSTIVQAQTVDKVLTAASNAIDSGKQAVKEGVQYIDTSSTFKTVYSDIKSVTMALASSLKVGAEHVYEVMVKQQIAVAITDLVLMIIVLVCIIICIKNAHKLTTDNYDDIVGTPGQITTIVITGAIGLIGLLGIFITGMIPEMITGFINPEYGALKEIMEMVKK